MSQIFYIILIKEKLILFQYTCFYTNKVKHYMKNKEEDYICNYSHNLQLSFAFCKES